MVSLWGRLLFFRSSSDRTLKDLNLKADTDTVDPWIDVNGVESGSAQWSDVRRDQDFLHVDVDKGALRQHEVAAQLESGAHADSGKIQIVRQIDAIEPGQVDAHPGAGFGPGPSRLFYV